MQLATTRIFRYPQQVLQAVETVLDRLKNPPQTFDRHLETLANQGLITSVALLRDLHDEGLCEYGSSRVSSIDRSPQLLEANNQILANTQQGVAALLGSIDEDRPTILRKLNTIAEGRSSTNEQQIDSILDRLPLK